MERPHRLQLAPHAWETGSIGSQPRTLRLALSALCLATMLLCTACSSDSPEDGAAQADGRNSAPAAVQAQDAGELSPDERIEQVIAVAEQELGNEDGTVYEDALLDAGGELCYQRGYWCATFIWWSFREAGLSEYFCDGQMVVYPQRQAEFYEAQGRYHTSVDHGWQPERGDLMFFLYNDGFPGGERISHSEIVLDYDAQTGIVETISANPVVEYHEHSAYDADTRGFADVSYEDAA